jgi:hypothetical protein
MSAVMKEARLSSRVAQFLPTPKKMLIGGKWVLAVSGKTFDVRNPATGEIVARVAEGEAADIDAAVKAARQALATDRALSSSRCSTLTPSVGACKFTADRFRRRGGLLQ